MDTHLKGQDGERIALDYLKAKGFHLVDQNWKYGQKEVDLIMKDQDTIVFVEVKTRKQTAYGFPEEFVDTRKQSNLVHAASAWMDQMEYEGEIRFDIVTIMGIQGLPPRINHIPDAFFPYY
jgi:putative endonuclease